MIFLKNSESSWNLTGTKEERQIKLHSLAAELVTSFIDLSVFASDSQEGSTDHIFEYAKEVISLGLLYMELQDSIREGDGVRVLNCWRFYLKQPGIETMPLKHLLL